MFPFQRVVVGLDRSEADRDLLRYAAALAGDAGAKSFDFVHAMDDSAVRPGSATTHQQALEHITQSVASWFESRSAVTKACHVMHGDRVDRLLEFVATQAADLLLIGHRSGHLDRRSLSRRLAMNAPCSLWMAPRGSPPRFARILAAVDFSPDSAAALDTAISLAKSLGLSECRVLHVRTPSRDFCATDKAAVAGLNGFLDSRQNHGIALRGMVEEDDEVSGAIHRVAQLDGVDLIVIGARGANPSAAVLLGAEAEHLLRETSIPVLLAKPAGAQLDLLRLLLDRDFPEPQPAR
jgi:nucleotide-binding universal stress UspA family protein